jgi:hypothetical protein
MKESLPNLRSISNYNLGPVSLGIPNYVNEDYSWLKKSQGIMENILEVDSIQIILLRQANHGFDKCRPVRVTAYSR